MIRQYLKLIITCAAFSTALSVHAFDCSVIYDEFDSLMHKDFLVSPDNYVSTISGEISFEDFNATQRGKLHLRKDRPEKGVGIIYTNDKLYGKFLFDWQDHQQIIFEDIIIYNRVEDGYAPLHHGFLTLNQGEQIDLDAGKVFLVNEENDLENIRADLFLSVSGSSNPVLQSINEARVFFPTASLCQ